jgi:hypothetical protein
MRVRIVLAAVAMVALLAGVSEAQNTYIYTPEGTYTVHAIPSGVDNNGVPLGIESGQGRDSYTNYSITPPFDSRSITGGGSGHKTKRMVIEVEEEDEDD